MFDKVHTPDSYLPIFRCDYCNELVPTTGNLEQLRESSISMYGDSWVVCCYNCTNLKVEYAKIGLHRPELSFSYLDLATYDIMKRNLERNNCTVEQKAELMEVAHFIGDRPSV